MYVETEVNNSAILTNERYDKCIEAFYITKKLQNSINEFNFLKANFIEGLI